MTRPSPRTIVHIVVVSAAFAVLLGAWLPAFPQSRVSAGQEHNLSGFAWSSNIGWISFNSENCDSNNDGLSDGGAGCARAGTTIGNYGVSLGEPVAGYRYFSGFAWSSNIGWISFNSADVNTAECPIFPSDCRARLDTSTNKTEGFARAIAGTNDPDDGWGGWIKLGGLIAPPRTGSYSGFLSGTEFSGFSWGEEVTGWLKWGCPSCQVPFGIHIKTSTLDVVKDGGGSGVVVTDPAGIDCGSTCTAEFQNGQTIIATATADEGSTFVGWDGCPDPDGPVCSINLVQNLTITATFTATPRIVTVTIGGTGNGQVSDAPNPADRQISCPNDCRGTYDNGTQVQLVANVLPGSSFEGWTGDCASANGTVCVVTVDADKNVGADFSLKPACNNDLIDDDQDGVADIQDPGCHSDGDPNNSDSYTPDKMDENDPAPQCPPPHPVVGNPSSYNYCPRCNDGIDNDQDGTIDWNGAAGEPKDRTCAGNASKNTEGQDQDIYEF